MKRFGQITLFLFSLTMFGCAESFPVLKPFKGTIKRNNETVKNGGLIFTPEKKTTGLVVDADIKPDGTFILRTTRTTDEKTEMRDGAASGRYRVTYHPPNNGAISGLDYEFPEIVTLDAGNLTIELTLPNELPKGQGAQRDDDPNSPKFDPNRKD